MPSKKQPNPPSASRKRRRSPSEMTPTGKMLEFLRLERGQNLTEFARSAGLSHGVLSAIAYGAKRLTPGVLDKLRVNLGLTEEEIERLQEIDIEGRDDMLTTGLAVPADRLIGREAERDVDKAWVVDIAPKEEIDSKWRELVVRNLLRHCHYVYFVPHRLKAETIEFSLREGMKNSPKRAKAVHLQFVIVPQALHPHFFHPTRVLLHLNTKQIIGIWAFRSRRYHFADRGLLMDQETADTLWAEYGRILARLKGASAPLADDSLEFQLIERDI